MLVAPPASHKATYTLDDQAPKYLHTTIIYQPEIKPKVAEVIWEELRVSYIHVSNLFEKCRKSMADFMLSDTIEMKKNQRETIFS